MFPPYIWCKKKVIFTAFSLNLAWRVFSLILVSNFRQQIQWVKHIDCIVLKLSSANLDLKHLYVRYLKKDWI